MSNGHNVRVQLLNADKDSNALSEAKELAKDITAGGFRRGKFVFQDDRVVFAPAINDSKLLDVVDSYVSIGPISPVQLLGLYSPYKTSLRDAARYDGYRELTYASITGVSFVAKGKIVEVVVESTELPTDSMLRARVDSGIWLWPVYNGNKRAGAKVAHELLERADAHGGVELFNASGLYSGPTKAIDLDYEPEHDVEYPTDHGTQSTTAGAGPSSGTDPDPGRQKRPPDAQPEAGGAERRDAPWLEDTTRTLTVRNRQSDPIAPTVGVRTDDETVFVESLTLEPDDHVEFEELPNTPFEVGTKLDGTVFSTRFDEHDDPETVTVAINSSGIHVSKAQAKRPPETEETPPDNAGSGARDQSSNEPTEGSTQRRASAITRSPREDVTEQTPGESTTAESAPRGGKKSMAAGVLAFLLVPVLLVSVRPPHIVASGLWGLSVLLFLSGVVRFVFRK